MSIASGEERPRKRLPAAARREVIVRAATEVFAERGYHGASIDEIARRSGVSPPVVYDHFASKQDLHARLLERTRDELLEVWRKQLAGAEPTAVRVPRAIEAWAAYVEANPFATRMFFRETTSDPEVLAAQRAIRDEARGALTAILAHEPGAGRLAAAPDAEAMEMAAETIRSALTGLAIWWSEHPHVPRERVVATAVNVLLPGIERAAGEGRRGD